MRAEQQNTTGTYEGNAVQVSDLSGIIMTCSGSRRLLEGEGMMNERGIGSPEMLLTSVARERVAPQFPPLWSAPHWLHTLSKAAFRHHSMQRCHA
jgi:hypothetical protein